MLASLEQSRKLPTGRHAELRRASAGRSLSAASRRASLAQHARATGPGSSERRRLKSRRPRRKNSALRAHINPRGNEFSVDVIVGSSWIYWAALRIIPAPVSARRMLRAEARSRAGSDAQSEVFRNCSRVPPRPAALPVTASELPPTFVLVSARTALLVPGVSWGRTSASFERA